jgi:[protein-PII] uridylyltransferase
MLYLLTWADAKATGPRAWNEWVANLVQELFFKILHILEKGELATRDASHLVEETRGQVRRLLKNKMAPQDLEKCFEVMSPQYLLNTNPGEIAGHLTMVKELKEKLHTKKTKAFILETRKNESNESWVVTFLAKDRPGLFSDLAGVLALNNINVLSAQIYTWRDGTALDIFRVSSPPDPIHPEKTWERARMDLESTMKGKLSLAYRLDQKSGRSILSAPNPPSRPPRVIIDNEASDFFTLIEIFADDRVGLLYRITRILFDLKLDIRIAKISTKVDQVADVFYVRDLDGQKVEDQSQVEEIKEALLHHLQKG